MKYMFLLYSDESKPMNAEQAAEARAKHWAILRETTEKGIFHGANPLSSTATAFAVRSSNGIAQKTDGPYVETKEAVGGYYILDCRDVEEARNWAGRLAQTGCATAVEVRQICEIPGIEDVEPSLADAVHA